MSNFDYPSQPPPRQPDYNRLGIILLLSLLVGLLIWRFWPWHGSVLDPGAKPRAIAPRGGLLAQEIANINVYDTARKSVVSITTLGYQRDPSSSDLEEVEQGAGSGFIWDEKGYVVTNFHVIQDAQAAEVSLWDGSKRKARAVGFAPDKDLAVLKIDSAGTTLTPISVGSSSDLKVGQIVYAIGNPFRLGGTFSDGVLSALDRKITSVTGRPIDHVLQTTAQINPGNSGGPLLDSSARLIGVTTAIYSPTGAYAGIGFAIPVDAVNEVVPELIRQGKVDRPGMGVQIAAATTARRLGIKTGVLVMEVIPGGAAAKAGLQSTRVDSRGRVTRLGDIIVNVDDNPVTSADDLFKQLASHKVGDTVKLTILREGERQDVPVTLEAI